MLQGAGIKLSSVATDILGVSGRAMMDWLVEGRTNPEALAELARGRLRAKLPKLCKALAGRFTGHHAFLVREILAHLEQARLITMPGVQTKTVKVMVAEVGVDMSKFPTRKHLGSWSGLAPGQHQSAGRRKAEHRPTRWSKSRMFYPPGKSTIKTSGLDYFLRLNRIAVERRCIR